MSTPVSFLGISSVSNRTLFTRRGPIVKKPIAILTGSDLRIIDVTNVLIPSGNFTASNVGQQIIITGSANARNDGAFYIQAVVSPTQLTLTNVNFSTTNITQTTNDVIALANDIRRAYNAHILAPGVHQVIDLSDLVTIEIAVDLVSAELLLNQIKARLSTHAVKYPGVHIIPDPSNIVTIPDATSLAEAIILANGVRRAFESHRQNRPSHYSVDFVDRVIIQEASATVGTYPGPLTGPFSWTLFNPENGQIADSVDDVIVRVNGAPVEVDVVFGLLGAIVLTNQPGPTDTITVDYNWLNNPPTQNQRLNSFEFNLNQYGSSGFAGLPSHRYRARSTLLIPGDTRTVGSSTTPVKVGWKYKGLERAYSACLNDPNTLLLNVPTNKLSFQGIYAVAQETVVRYDPTSLPQNSSSPWSLEGDGSGLSLAPGGAELTIQHNGSTSGTTNLPPFFSHAVDLSYPSITSAAFRAYVSSFTLDGNFTGVCFGLTDGPRAAIIGFLQTDAINLSSGITLSNALKSAFNAHITSQGVHISPDTADAILIVDATDLPSLIILSNQLLSLYNQHVNKGPSQQIHLAIDSADLLTSPIATSLLTSLNILNEMRVKFNVHIVSDVHIQPDPSNSVSQVNQVGIFTNRGYLEDQNSWNCYAADWTQYRTYRIFRDPTGNVSLYFSGISNPVASVGVNQLPPISSLDGKFDLLQQSFFGTIGKQSSSESKWAFIRIDINPLDSDQISVNKSVNYMGLAVPEMDPAAPWIIVGEGGYERIGNSIPFPTGSLVLDSTSSASDSVIESDALGESTGPYRGFLRLEPTLTSRSSSDFKFTASVGFYTFSVDNVASGIFIDDDTFAIHVVFLQANPQPAIIIGQIAGPYNMEIGDAIVLSVNDGTIFTVTFPSGLISAAQAAIIFNNVGIPGMIASSASGQLQLQTTDVGSNARITLIGRNALVKFGFTPGTFFGIDSAPEPKISWFGANRPDQDDPQWSASGSQTSTMLERTLRIIDSSSTDFLAYSLNNSIITNTVFNSVVDWKVDFRLASISYVPGSELNGLYFCGAFVNIDEGALGKNVEVQLAIDINHNPFIHIVTYDKVSDTLISIASFPFIWNDKKIHSFDLFTSKQSSLMIASADGNVLGTFSSSSLKAGVFGPAITFGSGSNATSNVDMTATISTFDWSSVCIFRDSRISDPNAAINRYIGLYAGGDPSLLGSYYLSQIDWTNLHSYRVVRNPDQNVSVYIDDSFIPSISVNYDTLSLPPVSTSFLQKVSNGRPMVAFGSFSPKEIDRTYWKPIEYSIGRITQTNGIVPPSQELNRANNIVSPDHLFTTKPHQHTGFSIYSGGTPSDDFMSDKSVPAYTILGEGTPPVPMTQNLANTDLLQQTFLPVETISPLDLVNQRGFLSDFEDDTYNVAPDPAVTYVDTITNLISRVNELVNEYNSHRIYPGLHVTNDVVNAVPGTAIDLATSISILNLLASKYTSHINQAGVHINNDSLNTIASPVATDISSAIVLVNEFGLKFGVHQSQGAFHTLDDFLNQITYGPSDPSPNFSYTLFVLNELVSHFNAHLIQSGIHYTNDLANHIGLVAVDMPTALATANALVTHFSVHATSSPYHLSPNFADQYTGPAPIDYNTLVESIDAMLSKFNTHISRGPLVHVVLDGVNKIADQGPISILLSTMQQFDTALVKHRTHTIQGALTYVWHTYEKESSLLPSIAYYNYQSIVSVLNAGGTPSYQSISNHANEMKANFNDHIRDVTHLTPDVVNTSSIATVNDLQSFTNLLLDLISRFNQHINGFSWHNERTGVGFTPPSSITISDPLQSAIAIANEYQTVFNRHIQRLRSHARADEVDLVLSPPATDLSSLLVLINEEKRRFNSHAISTVHVAPDLVNHISAIPITGTVVLTYEDNPSLVEQPWVVRGIGTAFTSELSVGSIIQFSLQPETSYQVSTIISDTTLTLTVNYHGTAGSATVSVDAYDLQTAGVVLDSTITAFEDHRVQNGVHGSSVFVRLDPPEGVLYDGMNFYPTVDGSPGLLSPFDDENLTGTLTYDGTVNVSNGSVNVVGTGTSFLSQQLYAGSIVQFPSQPRFSYIVQTVVDDTHMTLTTPYTGTSNGSTQIVVTMTLY